jgi:hypothetical protein
LGARVRAILPDAQSPDTNAEEDAEASTDADGTFRLEGLGDETYRLSVDQVSAPLLAHSQPASGGAENVTIVLRRGNALTLTVVDWNDRPVPGARVEILIHEQTGPQSWRYHGARTSETDHEGKVRDFTFNPEHRLQIALEPPADRDDLMRVPQTPWDRDQTRLVLPRGYLVTGVVRDDKGEPTGRLREGDSRGISIRVRPTGAPEFGVESDMMRLDGLREDGHFTVRVPYGTAKIGAGPAGEQEGVRIAWVDVSPESPTAELRLPQTAKRVTVRALGVKKGRSLAVRQEGEGGASPIWEKFVEDGRAEFPQLLPGTYTVWIPAEGDDPLLGFAEGVKVGDADPSVDLVKGAPIRVRVKLPAGAGPVDVHVIGPLGIPWPALQESPGVYLTGTLPPGKSWTVKAKARGPNAYLRASAEALAGAEIELEPK